MSNMLNTALEFMGFLTSEEEEEENNSLETTPRKNHTKIVSLVPKASQPTIVHITPEAFEEVKDIAKRLQDKNIVTINLVFLDVALRNRIFNFACGSVYALDGEVMELADNVYLLTGQGVTLEEGPRNSSKCPWSKKPQ